jgi:LuxR family transcriptional regulator, maltose regulon positive regulatory protein
MPSAAHHTLLSAREAEVLRVCSRGLSNREIGEHLTVTVGTVKGHLFHIYRKLNVHNRTAAVAKARGMGLLK